MFHSWSFYFFPFLQLPQLNSAALAALADDASLLLMFSFRLPTSLTKCCPQCYKVSKLSVKGTLYALDYAEIPGFFLILTHRSPGQQQICCHAASRLFLEPICLELK